ncbi:MAG: tRNA (adenosine(37)-N6)-threonylcarbamoyltransferase complex ATPase subunit type 1 TsaE [Shewanella sp.]|nr:tRNA (adenosine(37)-N6)-threonylcarbamoyltransferase complex ATPase subunit type 1 TsaE [Shewanella sp.]
MEKRTFSLADEAATVELGCKIAQFITPPLTVYLSGELGAGKTTFSRGLIQALGHVGAVKSPTYTIVEPYEFANMQVFHFDLYRLLDPEELEYMGIRDYFSKDSVCIIEWPDRGYGLLAAADINIEINYVNHGRELVMQANSCQGKQLIEKLK